ncbi:unknown protein [Microcystis aeruginosa NIES-843]|uniref:Uncharacterized protein n=1 Tax=Microcystis aeruginosa (strain NIES-843 / IAM M-2473) TaxID=449447 RepID=B0JVZ1_MICAN|nr:unknown protein [Microcystis aeruginosa NIES-843]
MWQQLSEKESKYSVFYRQMFTLRAVISMVRYKVSGFRESVVDVKSSHTSSL